MKRKNPLALLGALFALAFNPESSVRAAVEPTAPVATGAITGAVSNSATGNLLEGARVELVGGNLSTLTDNTGRYVLSAVPGGTHEIVVTYIGLDAMRTTVHVTPGAQVVRNIDLTTAIYKLPEFRVTGEREGDAAAITAQRISDNLKNVVAMDSFGNLPNMSVGEVVMRLPGIAGNPTEEGLHYGFNVRGMAPSLNTVTVDGNLIASIGSTRSFELQGITSTMFEQLELIKGHTPDKGADSLGGTINMKTRSPLSMKEKRRIIYSARTRIAPSFTEQIPEREQHRAHPLLNFTYQEVFDVFGGERNLGIAANLFYSENAVGGYRVTYDWQNTSSSPAFVWGYLARENFNNRKQRSANVRTDFRYSDHSKFSLNLTVNDNVERFRRSHNVRAYTGGSSTVPNATTTGVIPGGFTDKITQVRAVPAAMVEISTNGPNAFVVETYRAEFSGEHNYGRLQLDYSTGFSRNHNPSGLLDRGGQMSLTQRIASVGWILDRTASDMYPSLVQTGGRDWSDPENYRPIANGLTKTNKDLSQEVAHFQFNARYKLPMEAATFIKAGFVWREQSFKLEEFSRRWSYIGATGLPVDPEARPFVNLKTGTHFPRWTMSDIMAGGSAGKYPADESIWREDLYYRETIKYTGGGGGKEAATAGYLMAQGKLGARGWLARTNYLTGVRLEQTETEGWGWVRARFLSTTAQQQADPVGTAQRDYANNFRRNRSDYTEAFPSVHLSHDITSNLKARASWSTSFGRPSLTNLRPNETVSEPNETITVNNPGLLPQTAKNWDLSLEYYFEPVGSFSIGWFHKKISDFIVTGQDAGIVPGGSDNGYNGEYEGFRRLTSDNAGTATIRGWEFSYQQQFNFLPGVLRTMSGSVNYTLIDAVGDFGGAALKNTKDVAGFIPKAGNASLSWRYRGFSSRVLYNFTGAHIDTYSATSSSLHQYRFARNTVDLGLSYQLRPTLVFTCDIANLFNEKQRLYMGTPDRTRDLIANFVTVTVGVSGRF